MTPPIAQAGTADPIGCNTTSISLNGNGSSSSGNLSYLWTTSNGNILSGETTLNQSVDATGTYILVVTDEDNGCTAESTVTVTGSTDLPNADAGMPTNLTCATTELSLDGSNSDMGTYLWTTMNGNIISGNTTLTPTIDLPGTYQLEVTASNGCVSTLSLIHI